jgi:spore maturation protein CgeB
MNLPRVLFVGELKEYKYSTTASRLDGLVTLGLKVDTLDTTSWAGTGLWMRRFNHRTYFGLYAMAVNAKLRRAAEEHRPDIVWLENSMWVYPWTLRCLRRHAGSLVYYNTDDIFAPRSFFWLHRLGMRLHNLYLTTNRMNVLEIRQRYGVRTMRVGMGYESTLHAPPAGVDGRQGSQPSIVFVGHWEPHTEGYIIALQRAGLPVRVRGMLWSKARNPALRSAKPVPHERYVDTIASADIALCFLSRRNRNESTGRSFEIPAIGTFMLAERTAEHEFLYGDGKGAALFSTEEELVAKARYYLDHPKERRAIAAAGHARCLELGLSWADHMRREWPIVERLLNCGSGSFTAEDDRPFWPGFRQGQPFRARVCPR